MWLRAAAMRACAASYWSTGPMCTCLHATGTPLNSKRSTLNYKLLTLNPKSSTLGAVSSNPERSNPVAHRTPHAYRTACACHVA